MEKSSDHAFILITTSGNETMIEKLNKTQCFLLGPTVLLAGREVILIGTKSKKNLTKLLSLFNKIGKAELVSVSRYSFDREDMSEKQKDAVELAYAEKYYEWPRRTDIEGMAKIKKLSKSTFVEHLRKAEMKIIRQFVESH